LKLVLLPALPVFGVTIEEAVQRSMLPDGVQLPRIIRECIIQLEDKGLSNKSIFGLNWSEYITHVTHFSSHLFIALIIFPGLSQEGIYRLSGVKSKIEQLKELYNQGEIFFQTFPSLLDRPFKRSQLFSICEKTLDYTNHLCLFFMYLVTGKNADLDEFEPNILAGLIKLFIRELTDSILPEEIAQRFEEAAGLSRRSHSF
jgi:RalA-binding protein 1